MTASISKPGPISHPHCYFRRPKERVDNPSEAVIQIVHWSFLESGDRWMRFILTEVERMDISTSTGKE